MSLLLIRQKARDLHAKTRRHLLATLAVPLAVVIFYATSVQQFPNLGYLLHPLFTFAVAWSVAGVYFLNRGSQSGAMPGDAGFSTGLEFCRREIEQRRNYFGRDLLWSFGPVILALGTFVLALGLVAGAATSRAIPFMSLIVVWIAAYFFLRARRQDELQRELDELNDIERENGR